MRHAIIVGTGSYAPENRITNDNLAELVETSDEWIVSRTGIRERRISVGELTSDLAYKAAKRAVEDAKISPEDIELIICATITPDSFMPSVACQVQDRLGARRAAAFDLSAACTGIIYAAVTAAKFIESGMYSSVLVIGAETLSKIVDWEDRSTCVLFGDGAGAMVLAASDKGGGILASNLLADGSKSSLLMCPSLPLTNPYINDDVSLPLKLTMQGQDVFKFAVRTIADNINTILQKSSVSTDDIKYIIPHQANIRILEQAARYCNIPMEKFYANLELYGNTSAASIGIALDELSRSGQLYPGDKLILVGFGGGLTSGAILVQWV
ncbi:MAG: ketoacyl-ACP synthase III [Clostridiales bacterium]|nr:ketoacyl-ACP synthase III [Clostridiales bacterium]